MIEFLRDLAAFSFLQWALIGGLLASVAGGVMGTFVTVRRISSAAGAISHACLGGMGIAQYLNRVWGWTWFTPLGGAIVAAIVAALVLGWSASRGKEREDTVLSAIWALGMAIGIVFIFLTPGFQNDLMGYLLGNLLLVKTADVLLLIGLDVLVLVSIVVFYPQFLAMSFDEEFARLRGVETAFFNHLLLVLTALTVVVLAQVTGLILVIALLTLPAATAGRFSKRIPVQMAIAVVLSVVEVFAGLAVSYAPNLPVGAVTVLVCGLVYVVVRCVASFGRKARVAG